MGYSKYILLVGTRYILLCTINIISKYTLIFIFRTYYAFNNLITFILLFEQSAFSFDISILDFSVIVVNYCDRAILLKLKIFIAVMLYNVSNVIKKLKSECWHGTSGRKEVSFPSNIIDYKYILVEPFKIKVNINK